MAAQERILKPSSPSTPARADIGYRLIRLLVRALIGLFYRRVQLLDEERIPLDGPVIVAANHHNSAVDAMLIVSTFSRPVTVLAKAQLFDHWLVGPFLRSMGAVGVHRRQEVGDDPAKNVGMFTAVMEVLRAGGVVLIFPEGRTQPEPVLLPLRTGAARILLGMHHTPGATPHICLLPVGLVFHDPGTFRSARAVVKIGPPVESADLIETASGAEPEAVRTLTARLSTALRAQIVEAEDQYTLTLLEVLEDAWRLEVNGQGGSHQRGDPAASIAWRQRVMRGAAQLARRDPQRLSGLRHRIDLYRAHLEEAGLDSHQLGRPYRMRGVIQYTLENALWLAVGLPLALWGMACHGLPYWLTGFVSSRLERTAEEEATDKIAAGIVFYPAAWVLESMLAWLLGGISLLAVFFILLLPSGLLALAWRERLGRVGRQISALLGSVLDRSLHPRLLATRAALVRELEEVAALVESDGP